VSGEELSGAIVAVSVRRDGEYLASSEFDARIVFLGEDNASLMEGGWSRSWAREFGPYQVGSPAWLAVAPRKTGEWSADIVGVQVLEPGRNIVEFEAKELCRLELQRVGVGGVVVSVEWLGLPDELSREAARLSRLTEGIEVAVASDDSEVVSISAGWNRISWRFRGKLVGQEEIYARPGGGKLLNLKLK